MLAKLFNVIFPFCLSICFFTNITIASGQDNDTHFYLVRHGDIAANKDRSVIWTTDPQLNDLGIEQTNKLSNYLLANKDDYLISQVYSSNMLMARETGEIISKKLGVSARTEEDLRKAAIYAGGGSEKTEDVQGRMVACLEKIAIKHPGERIMIVTHVSSHTSFLDKISNGNHELEKPPNTSITHITLNSNGKWNIILTNATPHLN